MQSGSPPELARPDAQQPIYGAGEEQAARAGREARPAPLAAGVTSGGCLGSWTGRSSPTSGTSRGSSCAACSTPGASSSGSSRAALAAAEACRPRRVCAGLIPPGSITVFAVFLRLPGVLVRAKAPPLDAVLGPALTCPLVDHCLHLLLRAGHRRARKAGRDGDGECFRLRDGDGECFVLRDRAAALLMTVCY
eukprot:SAG22_NODE_2829_length_2173_cov_0.982160_1_plen_193_part_00